MFKVGDVIVYGAQGVCKIDCFETKVIGKQAIEYYVLKPIFNESTAVFVPVENEMLTAKMQDVLTIDQAKELIEKSLQISVIKFDNENEKREQYKDILASSDREKLLSLIKTIRLERDTRRKVGKKLNLNDEQTLRKAEQLLFNEMAFVLKITPEEAQNKIKF